MHPRFLQFMIHSESSSVYDVWSGYQINVSGAYSTTPSKVDFNDHLIREFNRKVYKLGFTDLLFTPYDAGFRLINN